MFHLFHVPTRYQIAIRHLEGIKKFSLVVLNVLNTTMVSSKSIEIFHSDLKNSDLTLISVLCWKRKQLVNTASNMS